MADKKDVSTVFHKFDPVIYPYKIYIAVSNNVNDIPLNFNEYSGKEIVFIENDTDKSQAFTMPVQSKGDRNYGVLIFFRTKKSMSMRIISHESSHAAKYLFEHIGADCSEHEPFEYVLDWIVACCEKVKNNKV